MLKSFARPKGGLERNRRNTCTGNSRRWRSVFDPDTLGRLRVFRLEARARGHCASCSRSRSRRLRGNHYRPSEVCRGTLEASPCATGQESRAHVAIKTIAELAAEEQVPRSELEYKRQRILDLLYATIQAMIVALVLVPKKARAFVAYAKQQTSQLLMQGAHIGGTCVVTVVCGAILPTGSSELSDPVRVSLTESDTKQTSTTKIASLEPSFVRKVEPEEPKALDAGTNECSSVDMKSTKIASYLQETLVPLAFVVAPALTQVACAGAEQQTPPAQQPADEPAEEPDGSPDPYEVACDQERARGNTCPPKEVWQKLGSGSLR